jgi:L-arabinose isomerase
VRRVDGWIRAAAGRDHLDGLRVARFGDNMRDVAVTEGDKVEAELRFGVSVNTYGVNDLVARVDAVPDADVDTLVAEYADSYRLAPELQRGGDRHPSLRYAARIEAGLREFLLDGRFGAFTTNFQDLGGLRQLPGLAVQRLMADGYGFGGEGDWKTAALLAAVKEMGADGPRGSSFMEDYTYHFGPGEPKILGAHMLEVCPTIAAATPTCEIHPLGIGDRARPPWSASSTWATGSGWWPTRSRSSRPTSRCRSCPSPARCGSPRRRSRPRPSCGSPRAARTTRCSPATSRPRPCTTSRR